MHVYSGCVVGSAVLSLNGAFCLSFVATAAHVPAVNLAGFAYSADASGSPSATRCSVDTYSDGLKKQRACVPCPSGMTTDGKTAAAAPSACGESACCLWQLCCATRHSWQLPLSLNSQHSCSSQRPSSAFALFRLFDMFPGLCILICTSGLQWSHPASI